jgi:very-short-patch-repair endonuclease
MIDPNLRRRARTLRQNPTAAEATLWKLLRGRKVENRRFRRQQVIGPYIVDFYCHAEKLVIELDGMSHHTKKSEEHQKRRTNYLELNGYSIIRFRNRLVFEKPDLVVDQIKTAFKDGSTES